MCAGSRRQALQTVARGAGAALRARHLAALETRPHPPYLKERHAVPVNLVNAGHKTTDISPPKPA